MCVCLIVCDLETSKRGGLGPTWAVVSQKKGPIFLELFIPLSFSLNYLGKLKNSATGKVCWTEYPSFIPLCISGPKYGRCSKYLATYINTRDTHRLKCKL